MSKIFLIGATGGVGSKLGPMLINAGHEVTALHRKPEQASDLIAAGMTPCLGDLMQISSDELVKFSNKCDVIVFSAGAAGSGLERTSAIDGEAVVKAIDAAKINNISRFYLVSAFMDAGRDLDMNKNFEHYMKVKRQADNALAASTLDWVILRPGALTNQNGNGLINANLAIPFGPVSRSNVAAALAELIVNANVYREIIEITDGDIPIKEAVSLLIRDKKFN